MAWIWRSAMAIALLGAVGCDSGTMTTDGGMAGAGGSGGAGGTGGGSGAACPGDPLEGAVLPECGVWVSTSLGEDTNKGTQDAPVASLTRAIELAAEGTGHIYACGETWTESLVVPSGISLHGGFDCENDWEYVGEPKRAMLVSTSPYAMKWVDSGSTEQAYFTDFYVESADATEPGGSSIAIFITANFPLKLIRCEVVAGDGADGADGAPGDENNMPAAAGIPGIDGGDACSGPVSKGGAAPENVCDGVMSRGGAGGDASQNMAQSGAPGEPIGPGGLGGLGEQVSPSCTGGGSGALGEDGAHGLGGTASLVGRMTVEGVFGYPGQDGKPGMPGQGGGGGGATFGNVATCGAASPGGAAGGSGGSGGCGGKGGRGGQPGGYSIGLASLGGYDIEIAGVVLWGGKAGNGGNGGPPQSGGIGGPGGKGGSGAGSVAPGCSGGNGGKGGRGGFGGGASGGSGAATATGPEAVGFIFTSIQRNPGEGGFGGQGAPNFLDGLGKSGFGQADVTLGP